MGSCSTPTRVYFTVPGKGMVLGERLACDAELAHSTKFTLATTPFFLAATKTKTVICLIRCLWLQIPPEQLRHSVCFKLLSPLSLQIVRLLWSDCWCTTNRRHSKTPSQSLRRNCNSNTKIRRANFHTHQHWTHSSTTASTIQALPMPSDRKCNRSSSW